jgi:hypothetical protein
LRHEWGLTAAKMAPLHTRLEWRCPNCTSTTFTQAPSNVGSHGSWAYAPGTRAMRATWVDEDCRQALVDRVHEL